MTDEYGFAPVGDPPMPGHALPFASPFYRALLDRARALKATAVAALPPPTRENDHASP